MKIFAFVLICAFVGIECFPTQQQQEVDLQPAKGGKRQVTVAVQQTSEVQQARKIENPIKTQQRPAEKITKSVAKTVAIVQQVQQQQQQQITKQDAEPAKQTVAKQIVQEPTKSQPIKSQQSIKSQQPIKSTAPAKVSQQTVQQPAKNVIKSVQSSQQQSQQTIVAQPAKSSVARPQIQQQQIAESVKGPTKTATVQQPISKSTRSEQIDS